MNEVRGFHIGVVLFGVGVMMFLIPGLYKAVPMALEWYANHFIDHPYTTIGLTFTGIGVAFMAIFMPLPAGMWGTPYYGDIPSPDPQQEADNETP